MLSACNFCCPEAMSRGRSKGSALTLVSEASLGLLTVMCSACQHQQHSQERVRCAVICTELQSVFLKRRPIHGLTIGYTSAGPPGWSSGEMQEMFEKREAAWDDACEHEDTVPPFIKKIHDYASSLWVRDACLQNSAC